MRHQGKQQINMDNPNSDWVVYKAHTNRSDLEKNFKEYQMTNNTQLKREQENVKNICRVLDTQKRSLRHFERESQIQTEGNFTHKLCRNKTCKNRKKTCLPMKYVIFDQEPECGLLFSDDYNAENVDDRLEDKAVEDTHKKRLEKTGAFIEKVEIKCPSSTSEQKLCFVSQRPLV